MMALKTERVCDFGCRMLADGACMLCGRDACSGHSPHTFYIEVGVSRAAASDEISQNRGTGAGLLVIDANADKKSVRYATTLPAGQLCRDCNTSLQRSSLKLDPERALAKAASEIADNIKAAYAAAALAR